MIETPAFDLKRISAEAIGRFFIPTRVDRVWGHYTVLCQGPHYKVKRLATGPGHAISRQFHFYRSELWMVVEGSIVFHREGDCLTMHPGDNTFIPAKVFHGAENQREAYASVIEIQFGSYVGEDDIVRLTQSL